MEDEVRHSLAYMMKDKLWPEIFSNYLERWELLWLWDSSPDLLVSEEK
jgi:hypothetical protein